MTTLNTNYKIPEITLNNLCDAIAKIGFDEAFDMALEKAVIEIRESPDSILIAECLSWSFHLGSSAACSKDATIKEKYTDASLFCRKLAHHVYWAARKEMLVEYNPNFIQVVK